MRAYVSREGNDGNNGDPFASTIPWTRHVDCMLALWSVCLGAVGSLMYNSSSNNEDKDDDDNDGLSLEGFCLVLILQNAIDSVILNDDPSGDRGGVRGF